MNSVKTHRGDQLDVEADIRAELGRLKCNNKDPDETHMG